MTTSVAMCTYNGARFIREQLDSILNQSLPIDEIVICDDGSTDGTLKIIQQYINRFPNRILLHQNLQSLGVCANFAKAIELCTKDCIFLADQDDVWTKDKTKTIVAYFEQHLDKSVVISNANLIDESGHSISDFTLFDVVGLTEQLKYFDRGFAMEIFLQANRATGCTMALRKNIVQSLYINKNARPNQNIQIHDGCIAMSAIIENAFGYIKEPITLYRQHLSQTCGLDNLILKPRHFPSPIGPLNFKNISYGINHPRIDMQLYRAQYTHKAGVLKHIKMYKAAYGIKLMWIVLLNDICLRSQWLAKRAINAIKKLKKLL
jgi:glycosyltransferase involved in cell wall biosynthesis